MKLLRYAKDGGPESTVSGFFIVEIKSLFSIVLLRFEDGSRDAYHEHAFNSVSWVLRGKLKEHHKNRLPNTTYEAGWRPVVTKRSTFHKVTSIGRTWVLSFRGPWSKTWREWVPQQGYKTLTHGRKEVT